MYYTRQCALNYLFIFPIIMSIFVLHCIIINSEIWPISLSGWLCQEKHVCCTSYFYYYMLLYSHNHSVWLYGTQERWNTDIVQFTVYDDERAHYSPTFTAACSNITLYYQNYYVSCWWTFTHKMPLRYLHFSLYLISDYLPCYLIDKMGCTYNYVQTSNCIPRLET